MFRKTAIATALISSFSVISLPAFAADEDEKEKEKEVEKIAITGSHIARSAEELSPPVDVISREEFEAQGSPSMLDIIQNMPAVSGSDNRSDQYSGGTANTGQQVINLRGLGADRTLTLINGKRLAGGDVGVYPQIALKSIELLKNGGSTTYGSSAIGGVFNYITRDRFEGVEMQASYSDINGSDGDTKFGVIGGVEGDNYNLVGSFEYQDRSGLRVNDANLSVDPNPANGSWILGKSSTGHPGAYLPYDPVRDIANQGVSALRDPACGTTYGESASFPEAGGKCGFYFTNFTNVTDPAERFKVLIQGSYDLDDSKELYASVHYASMETHWFTSPSYLPSAQGINFSGVSPAVIHPENPGFVDFASTVGFDAPGFENAATDGVVFVGRIRGAEGPALDIKKTREKYNFTFGSRGFINDDVSYDASISYDYENLAEPDAIEVLNTNFRNALAGLGGDNCSGLEADRGNAAAGCLWYNPFGSAINAASGSALANSDEVFDYMMGDYTMKTEVTQIVADLVFSGDLPFADLPGGSIAWAAGAQWIDREGVFTPTGDRDAALYPEGFIAFGALPTGYKATTNRNTTSLFVEAQLPVFDNLIIDLGMRYVDYDLDSVTTPKLSARWDITDSVALRASYEEGFRRPVLPQSVASGIAQLPGTTSYITVETPIPDSLEPETSENTSFGLIANPIDGLNITVDYWSIKLMDPFSKEAAGSPDAEIVFDPVTFSITKIITELTNGGDIELEGVDVEVDYVWDTDFAKFQVGINGTYLSKYDMFDKVTGELVHEAAGAYNYQAGEPFNVEALPQLRSNAYVSMMKDNHFFRLYARYIEEYEVNSAALIGAGPFGGIENPSVVEEFITFDAHYTYNFSDIDTAVTLSVSNLTDEKAPAAMHFIGYDARTHSPLGRVTKLSVKYAF